MRKDIGSIKEFRGQRRKDNAPADVVVVLHNGETLPLDPRTDLIEHSSTGFEWGYRGAGPSQLALALSAAVAPDAEALKAYRGVADLLAENLHAEQWSLPVGMVYAAVHLQQERATSAPTQHTAAFRQVLHKALDAARGGEDAWAVQSTGERLAVAIVLNRPDWIAQMDYTLAEAIDRIGPEWCSMLAQVERAVAAER